MKLHLLYNTAGVMGTPKGKLSDDGYEMVLPLTAYQVASN